MQGNYLYYPTGHHFLLFKPLDKGGPGFMYLLQGKPVTPAKLIKDKDLIK